MPWRPASAALAAGLILTLLPASATAAGSDPTDVEATGQAAETSSETIWGVDAERHDDGLLDDAGVTRHHEGSGSGVETPPGTSSSRMAAAASPTWTLSGSGWGHGVGMSQWGAMEMARDGRTAEQILKHYYTGSTYDPVNDTSVIAVNLRNRVPSSTMVTSALSAAGGTVRVTAGGRTMTGGAGASLRATVAADGAVSVSCTGCTPLTQVSGASASLEWDDDRTLLAVDGTRYKDGRITVTRAGTTSALHVIAHVRIHDEYLDYINEVPWSWPIESLKAQAAAARGYAISALSQGLRSDCGCHVFDTTTSQVFGGYPSAANLQSWPNWTAAVRAAGSSTEGYVVRHQGRVIQAFYSSSSGGRTQNNEDVWGGTALPYLRSVDDPWSLRPSNPRASWSVQRDMAALATAFRLPDVVSLNLSRRHVSGGLATAVATSSTGATAQLGGETFRSRLGLHSTYVRVSAAPDLLGSSTVPLSTAHGSGVYGDVDGNGTADLVGLHTNGQLYLYTTSADGPRIARTTVIGENWGRADWLGRVPDVNGDGVDELLARRDDGTMWLLRGHRGGGFSSAVQVGSGFSGYRTLVVVPRFLGDAEAVLLSVDAFGRLERRSFTSLTGQLGAPVRVGHGWNPRFILSAQNFLGDGRPNVLMIDHSGRMYAYTLVNGLVRSRGQVGHGWSNFGHALVPGDIDADGRWDLLGIRNDGNLYFYRNLAGGRWGTALQIGARWGGMLRVF
ncbi:MAG TPA: SpoIID/LytB domain-containing protein [Intrasporangiaceae bacterium]|nr:SpoIID/LytB domain-containing protein [Intrasporangiaceae bacterium]